MFKYKTKALSLLLAVLLLTATLASCAPSNTEEYTLTIWGAEEDQKMLEEMCNTFAAAHPENRYKFLFGVEGESNVADRVLNDVESGPDIYSFPSDQINKLYVGGALARVGGEIEKNIIEVNSEGSVDAATLTVGGEKRLYAYPTTGDNCYFVYYDKRVYTDPADLASLDRMLQVAEAAGKEVHFRLNDDGWYLSSFFFADPDLKYEVTYNENLSETAIEINYDSADGLEVMKALRAYIERDAFVVQTDDSKIIAGFTASSNGKTGIAAAVSGTWNAETLKSKLGDNLGVCKLPTARIGGQDVQLSGFMGYKLMGVNGYSKNKGEAHKLAQWLTNEENQLKRYETRGFAPTNQKVLQSEAVKNDVILSAVLDQAQYNRTQKGVPSTYWTPMGSLITPLVTKEAGTTVTDQNLQGYLTALCEQIRKKAATPAT